MGEAEPPGVQQVARIARQRRSCRRAATAPSTCVTSIIALTLTVAPALAPAAAPTLTHALAKAAAVAVAWHAATHVQRITHERMADEGRVDADLVRPPGVYLHLRGAECRLWMRI